MSRVRSDQILVQFDTESQTLPPLNALTKYMSTMSTHGKANELGLRRRCDRWAVVEPGLIKTPVLEIDDQSLVIRIEECGMVKTISRRPRSRDPFHGNSSVYSPHESGSVSTIRATSPITGDPPFSRRLHVPNISLMKESHHHHYNRYQSHHSHHESDCMARWWQRGRDRRDCSRRRHTTIYTIVTL